MIYHLGVLYLKENEFDNLTIYGNLDTRYGFFWCMLVGGVFGIFMNAFIYFVLFVTKNLTNHLRVLKCLAFTDMLQNMAMVAQVLYPASAGLPNGTFGDILCRFYLSSFIVLTLTTASSWLVVFLTMELLGASKGDLKPKWYTFFFGTKTRIRCLFVFSWFLGLVIMFDSPFNFRADGNKCILGNHSLEFLKYIGLGLQFSLVMVVPLIIVFVCYFRLFRETTMAKRHHEGRRDFDPHSEFLYQCAKTFMRSLCMRLTLIVVFYILAWVPNQIFWYVYVAGNTKLEGHLMNYWFNQLVQLSPLINCALNPFLYGWTWFEFRGIVIPKLRRVFRCHRRQAHATKTPPQTPNHQRDSRTSGGGRYTDNNRDTNYAGIRTQTLPPEDTSD